MRLPLLALLWLAALPVAAGTDTLERLLADYTRFEREFDPVRAAERGDAAAARRWPDNSPGAVGARAEALAEFARRLSTPAMRALSGADALNRDLVAWRVEIARAALTYDPERMAFVSGDGFYTKPDYAALNTVLTDEAAAQAWLERLAKIPAYYATETANLRRGIATGFTQPALVVERVIRDLDERLARAPSSSPLLAPFATLPQTMPAEQRAALRQRGTERVRDAALPAERALRKFLQDEYLRAARANIAVSSLPGGADYYTHLVRWHTTTQMSVAEIHALGEREVRRIRAAMDEVRAATGVAGDFTAFLAFARAEPRFYLPAASYGEKAAEVAKRADAALPRFFGLLPRLPYGVAPMPAGLEGSSNGYLPGSPEQGVAGLVVYKPWLAEKLPVFGLAAWVLHEGVPGHHLQIALAQELHDVPEFRRNDDITAFVEGWGLYAEKLGEDMGIYRDPWERFGRLSLEMWRACRLVMDTGIHALGWSRERAGACLRENSALAETEIEFELDRYIGWPGQALAYKIGEQRIIGLRREASERLGARFDLRRFHDTVLGAGPLPLPILERRVHAWIETEAVR